MDTYAIVGESGHGKTTLAKALTQRHGFAVSDPVDWTIASRNAAIVVVSAPDGPMPGTRAAMAACREHGVNRVVLFVGKCDLVEDVELIELVSMECAELATKHGYADPVIVRGAATRMLANDHEAASSIAELLAAVQARGHG